MPFKEKALCAWVTAEGAFLLSSPGFPVFLLPLFLHGLSLLWCLPWACQQHLREIALTSTSSRQSLHEKASEGQIVRFLINSMVAMMGLLAVC